MALFNKKSEIDKKTDEIKVRVTKKDKKKYKKHAEQRGLKLSGLVISLLEGDINKGDK